MSNRQNWSTSRRKLKHVTDLPFVFRIKRFGTLQNSRRGIIAPPPLPPNARDCPPCFSKSVHANRLEKQYFMGRGHCPLCQWAWSYYIARRRGLKHLASALHRKHAVIAPPISPLRHVTGCLRFRFMCKPIGIHQQVSNLILFLRMCLSVQGKLDEGCILYGFIYKTFFF